MLMTRLRQSGIANLIRHLIRRYQERRYGRLRYKKLRYGDAEIRYCTLALTCSRGFGRASRSLLADMEHLAGQHERARGWRRLFPRRVYFYFTISDCTEGVPGPAVAVIHDVVMHVLPEYFPDARPDWPCTRETALSMARLVSISASSADDIARHLDIPRTAIRVIHNGASCLPVADMPAVKRPAQPYLVYIGADDLHKNLDVVMAAMQLPVTSDVMLVVIGHSNGLWRKIASALGLEARVMFTGWLPDDEVGYLLRHALALVMPSYYEGFGLPPVEAGRLGTPSILSRRPAMTEIFADAALFAAPDAPAEWAAAIAELQDPARRQALATRAQACAERYSWRATASQYLTLLNAQAV